MLGNIDWIEIVLFFFIVVLIMYDSTKKYLTKYHQPLFKSFAITFAKILLLLLITGVGYFGNFFLVLFIKSRFVNIVVFGLTIGIAIYSVKLFDKLVNDMLSE